MEIPVERVVEALNDVNLQLNVIRENFKVGKLRIQEASKLAERVITVYAKKSYGDGWEKESGEMFQAFLQRLIKQKSEGKEYVVRVPADS